MIQRVSVRRWKCGHCGRLYDDKSIAEHCEDYDRRSDVLDFFRENWPDYCDAHWVNTIEDARTVCAAMKETLDRMGADALRARSEQQGTCEPKEG